MAGDADGDRLFVLLLFITVFMRLLYNRRNRFHQRLRLLLVRARRRRVEAYFLQWKSEWLLLCGGLQLEILIGRRDLFLELEGALR